MIVNANPFETSFHENSNVMKFSSVAMNVTTPHQAGNRETGNIILRVDAKQGSKSNTNTCSSCGKLAIGSSQTLSIADGEEQVEEKERVKEEDPHVAHLLNHIEDLRERWLEAEIRCSAVESEVREEMAEEMGRHLHKIEDFYKAQLCEEASMNETKLARQMDLLTRAKNSEEATIVRRLQSQIRRLGGIASGHQRDVDRALESFAQADQRCQYQARVIEALESQLSEWRAWFEAAPCAVTTAMNIPSPSPKAVLRQDDDHGQPLNTTSTDATIVGTSDAALNQEQEQSALEPEKTEEQRYEVEEEDSRQGGDMLKEVKVEDDDQDEAFSLAPHSPAASTDDNSASVMAPLSADTASQPHLPVAERMENPTFMPSAQRQPTPEALGHASKKIRLRGGVAAIT
ncbi:hypothetical protein DFQ27_007885, partial [Actinomortierella ambigua]